MSEMTEKLLEEIGGENQAKKLITMAKAARCFSYSPYSHYQVGAALITKKGKVYQGCNIENAAYGPSMCAERVAFFKAVSEGEKDFSAIAILGGKETSKGDFAPPCGTCRQVMAEFCNLDEFLVIIAKDEEEYKLYTLGELLPESFGPSKL